MSIKNITKQTILAKDFKTCNTILNQARGLMFSKQANLLFKFKHSKIVPLHMFFVFYPIDVLYLNEDMEIVEIKENFRPFTMFNPKTPAKYILELKKGRVSVSKSEIGDKISINKLK